MIPFATRFSPFGQRPSRREWLRLGIPTMLSTLGTTIAKPARAADRKSTQPRAKTVLLVFTSGGQSQLDMWDPKPNAPVEIRGAFSSIPTSVPGLRFCELMPRIAKLANRFTVLKSMTHDDADHGSACYLALTGQSHQRKSSNPPPRPTDFPMMGAVLHRVRPTDRFPHSAMQINGPLLTPREPGPGQYGGILGRAYDPIELGDVTAGSSLLDGLERPDYLTAKAAAERRTLASQLDAGGSRFPDTNSQTQIIQKAYELMNSPQTRNAFDITQESSKVRDRYGRYRAGQACLLARRLVEAGVPWITVFLNHSVRGQDIHPEDSDEYGWDTHNDIFDAMKTHLLPRFDLTLSALLEDLEQRGLMESTLVVCMGEFGRAPLVALEKNFVGTTPGRKHWPQCYSIMLAGAGIKPGAVYGNSDRHAAYPQSNPVTPGDISATMFDALGVNPDAYYNDAAGRPNRIATGQPVTGLFL